MLDFGWDLTWGSVSGRMWVPMMAEHLVESSADLMVPLKAVLINLVSQMALPLANLTRKDS